MSDEMMATTTGEPESVSISWHALSSTAVLEQLETRTESGLSSEEVQARQETYGLNELEEAPPTTFWEMLWDQINSFVIYMLVYGDGANLNAIMGIIQESRAEAALTALKKLAAPEANVVRDGHRVSVPAPQLVPGDIVFLEAGNYIPADVRLLEAINLKIDSITYYDNHSIAKL